MREIKFRIWIEKFKEFKYWGFIDGIFISPPIGSQMSIAECKNGSKQFTGLKDKNEKDVCEGDIMCWLDLTVEILYVGGSFSAKTLTSKPFANFDGFDVQEQIGAIQTLLHKNIYFGEIIGNIYQNPELLK